MKWKGEKEERAMSVTGPLLSTMTATSARIAGTCLAAFFEKDMLLPRFFRSRIVPLFLAKRDARSAFLAVSFATVSISTLIAALHRQR
jgi:hypothetical protein